MTEKSPSHTWQHAFKHSYPVAMGYLPAGIAFGVLMQAANLPAWWAVFLSVVLYAGAAQYATIPLLAAGTSIQTLTFNVAAINLRHIFYALPLLEELPSSRWQRAYCLFALTDESYSVLTTLSKDTRQQLFFPIVLLNQCYWVLATIIGVTVAAGLHKFIPHLDFALVCLFAILAYEQYTNLPKNSSLFKKMLAPSIAVLAFVCGSFFEKDYVLLVAISLCAGFILMHHHLTHTKVK